MTERIVDTREPPKKIPSSVFYLRHKGKKLLGLSTRDITGWGPEADSTSRELPKRSLTLIAWVGVGGWGIL